MRWPDTPTPHTTVLSDYLKDGVLLDEAAYRARFYAPMPTQLPPGAVKLPFLLEGYSLHVGPTWEVLTASGSDVPVAVYRYDYSLRVADEHRGTGVAVMMVVWRDEHRGQGPRHLSIPRTATTWRLTNRAHRIIVRRALDRGWHVPAEVLADYPDLQGDKNGT